MMFRLYSGSLGMTMAILPRLRVGLHRSLAPVAAKAMISRHSLRGIIDYPMNSYESSLYGMLLHKSDLPPFDDDYFRVVTKEYFIEKYGDAESIFIYESAPPSAATQQIRIPKRLAAVLPLDVKNLGTIPIPFIVDSGAPGGVYLGTRGVQILMQLKILKEIFSSRYPYVLKDATLSHGEIKCHNHYMRVLCLYLRKV